MNLTAENTAIVLDSTSDFPDAARALPEHAGRPALRELRRRELPGPRRHRLARLLRAPARAPELPTTSQPTPQDFLDVLRAARGRTSGSTRCSSRPSSRAPTSRAVTGGRELGGDRIRVVDTETASLAVGLLALAIQRRLARGTTDEEIEALIERFKEENGVVFTVATLEYLQKGGRIGRAQALAGTLLNVKPILSVDDGVVIPIGKVRGRQKALEEFAQRLHGATEDRAGPARRDRPRRRTRVDRGAHRSRREGAPAGRDRARREPRRRRRHPCRPGRRRLLLVPGLTPLSRRAVGACDPRRSYTRSGALAVHAARRLPVGFAGWTPPPRWPRPRSAPGPRRSRPASRRCRASARPCAGGSPSSASAPSATCCPPPAPLRAAARRAVDPRPLRRRGSRDRGGRASPPRPAAAAAGSRSSPPASPTTRARSRRRGSTSPGSRRS